MSVSSSPLAEVLAARGAHACLQRNGREFSELLVAQWYQAEISADRSSDNQASRGGYGKKIREIGLKSREGGPKLSLTLRLNLNLVLPAR